MTTDRRIYSSLLYLVLMVLPFSDVTTISDAVMLMPTPSVRRLQMTALSSKTELVLKANSRVFPAAMASFARGAMSMANELPAFNFRALSIHPEVLFQLMPVNVPV